jgi:hypothetical protein
MDRKSAKNREEADNQTSILQSVSSVVTTTPLTMNPKLKNHQIIFTARSETTAISPITAADVGELKESKQHNEITICRKLSTKRYFHRLRLESLSKITQYQKQSRDDMRSEAEMEIN